MIHRLKGLKYHSPFKRIKIHKLCNNLYKKRRKLLT